MVEEMRKPVPWKCGIAMIRAGSDVLYPSIIYRNVILSLNLSLEELPYTFLWIEDVRLSSMKHSKLRKTNY